MIAISVENVSKKFILAHDRPKNLADAVRGFGRRRPREDFWALGDVSFDVESGEALGIIGHNGAGKSTMLKLLTRIMRPTKGGIRTRGRVSALIEVGAGFHPEMTGRENIYLNGSILGMTKLEIDRKLDAIIAFAELETFIDTPVKRYSSGMYARLGFSVAAHVNPDILLVDEALAVGDLAFQQKCYSHMDDLRRSGCSIVLVTHSTLVATRVCGRLVWLDGGRVREIGPSSGVAQRYGEWMTTASSRQVGVGSRWGSGDARLTAVRSEVKTGSIKGYDVSIDLAIEASVAVQNPMLWVMIVSGSGHKLVGSTTAKRPGLVPTIEGSSHATCTFKDIELLPGLYKVHAGVFGETLLPLDRWGDCASFEIPVNGQIVGLGNPEFDGSLVAHSLWNVEASPADGGGPSAWKETA